MESDMIKIDTKDLAAVIEPLMRDNLSPKIDGEGCLFPWKLYEAVKPVVQRYRDDNRKDFSMVREVRDAANEYLKSRGWELHKDFDSRIYWRYKIPEFASEQERYETAISLINALS
jgi:hypothetical protein